MVVLDNGVHRQAKMLAAQLQISLGELIEESLRFRFAQAKSKGLGQVRPLPTHKGKGFVQPGLSLDHMQTVYDALAEGRKIDKLR
jgi:hypothetical protein